MARIFPHGSLNQVATNAWQVEGSQSFPLKRNMTVYRLADGRLVLYSVVALDDAGMAALEALGRPWLMIVPGSHTLDARFYKERYPHLLVAHEGELPPNLAGLAVDGTPEELLAGTGVEITHAAGMKRQELALLLPGDSGKALVTCDILGRNGPRQPGIRGRILEILGPPGAFFGVARIVKLRQVHDKSALRGWIAALAARGDITAVLGSHGPPLTSDVGAALRQAMGKV